VKTPILTGGEPVRVSVVLPKVLGEVLEFNHILKKHQNLY
jgi:hypothetical protein